MKPKQKDQPVEEKMSGGEKTPVDGKLSNGTKKAKVTKPSTRNKMPAAASKVSDASRFPIVGVGASAGGLEAFGRLLKALPQDTGMAFVLVQHLDPGHESMLTRLLSSSTRMPVTEVQEGIEVQANHVYVIPPNTVMQIQGRKLHLAPRVDGASVQMPIDYFLRSLAENESNRAIGVILSGAASDGTLGLKAIKGEGGITFAQDEKSAKYDSMPRSAVAAGCVDFVLSPEGIAMELARIGKHPYLGGGVPPSEALPEPADDDLRKIFLLLRNATGIDFTFYKYNTIKRRIARRMVLLKLLETAQYLKYLRENRVELNSLYEDILIHVTSFFREPETFKELQEIVFPKILQGKPPGETIRIWVPGCSTGEEPYSIAMALLEVIGDRTPPPIQIFGTDISETALDKARAGIYPQSNLSDVSEERVRRFFARCDGGYQVAKAVREMCIFAKQDLVKDPPFSRLDLLSCRNVMIYMGPVLQKMAMTIFHYALKPTGYLVLGKAESIGGFSELFVPLSSKQKIFAKKVIASRAVFGLPAAPLEPLGEGIAKIPAVARFDVEKEADRIVIAHFAPAGLVANDNLQILQFRGNIAPFLSPSPGEASLSLPKMVRPEFAVELRTAVHRARGQETAIRKDGILIKRNGDLYSASLEVVPFKGEAAEQYFLVLFQDTRLQDGGKPGTTQAKFSKAQELEATRLRGELETTKSYLQSIIEEHEATNEELKSANEEILSSNEELQSTNEELETAKEELQSTNEELVTVNEQLQVRNGELAQLSDDLSNLLSGVDIPIVMLGNDHHIRRFTPLAQRLMNLVPSDIGRPINHIRPNVTVQDLEKLILAVTHSVSAREQEVQDAEGKWYSMRLHPYRTVDNKIDGVVMIFVEVDALKRTQQALREQSAFSAAILQSADALVMVTDADGRIVSFNRACEAVSGYSAAEAKGKVLWDDLVAPEEAQQVKAIHRRVLEGKGPRHTENRWLPKSGGERYISWSSAAIPDAQGVLRYVVRIGTDITERHRAEQELQRSETALRDSQKTLQTLAAGLIHGQEDERKRISRELHDHISQRLVALGVEAEAAIRTMPGGGKTQAQLRALWRLIGAIGEDVRRTAYQLHPSVLDHLGLAAAVKSYCADFSRQEGIKLRFTSRRLPKTIPADAALACYRIVQEALHNVARHSRARGAGVTLAGTSDGGLSLSVIDQGRGFDPTKMKRRGLGLITMEERTRQVGGTYALKTMPGEGVRIEVRIPLPGAHKTRVKRGH